MRVFALIAAIAACGGGDSAHDEVACDKAAWMSSGVTHDRCERGCAAGPSGGVDSGGGRDQTCIAEIAGTLDPMTGKPIRTACATQLVATFDGERGCCSPNSEVLLFAECEAM